MTEVPEPFEHGRLTRRAVGWLRQPGLQRGDRIVTLLPNTPATFALGMATMLEGIVQVPLPADLGPGEVAEIVDDADPAAIIADPDAVRADLSRFDVEVRPLTRDTLGDVAPEEPASRWPQTRPMAYTSGTTGRRKGVYVGVHDEDWGRTVVEDEYDAFDRRHGDLHLVVSPLYHSGPFRFAFVTALTAEDGRIAVLPSFSAAGLRDALRALRPTSMFCVPTHLQRLLALDDLTTDDLASLQLLVHAGAPCPAPVKEQVLELAPEGVVWEFYGSTEGQFTVCPPDVWHEAPGTVGHRRPDRRLHIRGEDGQPVEQGEVGTVWVEAPWHARWEYWRDAERTKQAWDGDAFTVGDLGHLDDDRRLFLDGRPGDLVITGGVNVYPAEVERRLLAAPGVAEAVAFGIPDEEWGERLVAAVVAWPDSTPDPQELEQRLRHELAPPKVPKRIAVVDDLPRTATGKIRRTGLSEALDLS